MIAAALAESPDTTAIPTGKAGLRAAAPPDPTPPPGRRPAPSRARSRARRSPGFKAAAIVIARLSARKAASANAAVSPAVLMFAPAISVSTDAIMGFKAINGFKAAIPAGGMATGVTAVSTAAIATGPATIGANFPA